MQNVFLKFFIIASLLSACSSVSKDRQMPELPLLPPTELGENLQVSQQVKITIEKESHTMLAAWVVKENTLSFVGLSPTGQRLLTLFYDGKKFSEEYSEMLPIKIPGKQVLAQLQFAHWPENSVKEGLEKTDWNVRLNDKKRELFFKRRKIFTIENSHPNKYVKGAKVMIGSELIDFSIDVTTLSVENL